MKTQDMLASSPYASALPAIQSAYLRGLNSGHGIACHNVPTLGAKLLTDALGRVTVDPDNIREVHESSCFEAEQGSRDFSPFEFTAHEFNQAGDGGFAVRDTADGEDLKLFADQSEAEKNLVPLAQGIADKEGCTLLEALECLTIEERPSSEELWEAYNAGVSDAISADLSTYTNEDYGITEEATENAEESAS